MPRLNLSYDSKNIDSKIYWCCQKCGEKALLLPENIDCMKTPVLSFLNDKCDVCQQKADVVEVREFGWPDFTNLIKNG